MGNCIMDMLREMLLEFPRLETQASFLDMSDIKRAFAFTKDIQERAVTWVRGLVNNFLRVPLARLGITTAAAQLWNS